jgi:predicted metal-dependent phosphoesterase TrpH
MVVADLHVHTTASDGTLTISEVPAAARQAGLEVVAITDHDRPHPDLREPISDHGTTAGDTTGVTVVHGIELRVATEQQRVDLLGYGLKRTPRLERLVDRLQTNRIERAHEIIDCVERRVGVELDLSVESGVGRPHIARSIAESDAPYGYQEAFDSLIGNDCLCYVSREIPSFETGIEVLSEACSVVALAHPFRYGDPEQALEYCDRLDAVEYDYPYDRAVDESILDRAVDEFDLLRVGGSDAHDRQLGRAGLGAGDSERFVAQLR